MSLVGAIATLGGLTGLSRIAGFARDTLTAALLGAGPVADAFFVALKLPNFFRTVTAEGAFSISFVPLYTEKKEKEGQAAASDFASRAISFMALALIPFTILMIAAMPSVIFLLAPGFRDDPEKFQLAVEMARLSFPYLLLVSIAALLGAVLNAHSRFGPYAFAPVLFNLSLIASMFIIEPFTPTVGHAMAIGMSVSGVLQILWVYRYVRKMGLNIRFTMPKMDADQRKLFRLMGPGILVAGAFQVNLFANVIIASFLQHGSISYLYYAERLYQLPFGVIGIAVGTALLPMFAQALAQNDDEQTSNLYNRAIQYMLILSLPCTVGLVLAGTPIIQTIYQHGAFTADDTFFVSCVLMGYAIGLPAYILSRIYNAAFYAHQDTWSPVKVALMTTGANVVLSVILAALFGVSGIAISTAIVGWGQLYLLHRAVDRKGMNLWFDSDLKKAFPKILICAGLAAATVLMMRYGLAGRFDGSLVSRTSALTTLIVTTALVYLIAIFGTDLVSVTDVKRFFSKRVKGPPTNGIPTE